MLSALRWYVRAACCHVAIKLFLCVILSFWFYGLYFFSGSISSMDTFLLKPSVLDVIIPFSERWSPVYLSIAGLNFLAPLFLRRRRDLLEYASCTMVLVAGACVIFVVFPVSIERPAVIDPHTLRSWLVAYDPKGNCLPSLHAGFIALDLWAAWRALRSAPGGGFLLVLLTAWSIVIVYSALALKQHYVVDVLAGLAWGTMICKLVPFLLSRQAVRSRIRQLPGVSL